MVFSNVKSIYRKAKLNAFINEKPFEYKHEIRKAFLAVKRQSVANCIRHATEIMGKIDKA